MKVVSIFILPIVMAILFGGRSTIAQDGYTDEFGVTTGRPIDNGVVFVDGEYIASPYTISRQGLTLYVNGREIKRPRRHMEAPVLTGEVDPSRLTGQERQQLYRALESTRKTYEEYLSEGYGYLFSSKGGHVRLSPHVVAYRLPDVITLLASGASRDQRLNRLHDYNWHLYVDVEPIVDKLTASPQLTNRIAQQAEELLRVQEFGLSDPCSIDTGFFFLKGRYIEPPYVLQRKGLGLFLNGELISLPPQWPVDIPSGDTDVTMPPTIDAEASWFDDAVAQYLAQKKAYLFKQYSRDQAIDMMAQATAALPLVNQAQRDEARPDLLHVTTTEGQTILYALLPTIRRGHPDRGSTLRSVQSEFNYMRQSLGRGACLFVSDGCGTCLSPATLSRTLPQTIEVLRSSQPEGTKSAAVKQLGLGMPDKVVRDLVCNYSQSSKLDTRMAGLSSKGDQPKQP